jgi:hypothetical protein
MDKPDIRFGAITMDCAPGQVEAMVRFWCGMLDLKAYGLDGPYPFLEGKDFAITLQPEELYAPPPWPETDAVGKQLHVDLLTRDIPAAAAYARSLGATDSPVQYSDRWHILLDPAGHPFCLCRDDSPAE